MYYMHKLVIVIYHKFTFLKVHTCGTEQLMSFYTSFYCYLLRNAIGGFNACYSSQY